MSELSAMTRDLTAGVAAIVGMTLLAAAILDFAAYGHFVLALYWQ